MIGKDKNFGSKIEKTNFIQYTSLSLYPNDGGFLNRHYDGHMIHDEFELIHFKLELTHKYVDYEEGGFYIWDNLGKQIDVSALVKPSDVIFFKGSNYHEIKPIKGEKGRIALFEIPTYVLPESRLADYSSDGDSKFIKIKRRFKKNLRKLISKI
tara:strand:- start:1178 stop:1639 length:462 start_codon:yes stop_codon:yes gene_type:complete